MLLGYCDCRNVEGLSVSLIYRSCHKNVFQSMSSQGHYPIGKQVIQMQKQSTTILIKICVLIVNFSWQSLPVVVLGTGKQKNLCLTLITLPVHVGA